MRRVPVPFATRKSLAKAWAAVLLVLLPLAMVLPAVQAAFTHRTAVSKSASDSDTPQLSAAQGLMPPVLKLPQALPPIFFQALPIPLPQRALVVVLALPAPPTLAWHKCWHRLLFRTGIQINAP